MSHFFARRAAQKTHGHARIARETCVSRVFSRALRVRRRRGRTRRASLCTYHCSECADSGVPRYVYATTRLSLRLWTGQPSLGRQCSTFGRTAMMRLGVSRRAGRLVLACGSTRRGRRRITEFALRSAHWRRRCHCLTPPPTVAGYSEFSFVPRVSRASSFV